jgi:hypothetical protein
MANNENSEPRIRRKQDKEALRNKGQFWTPNWIAEAMAGYAFATEKRVIFDPGVGAGAFFRAARKVYADHGKSVELLGTEIDPEKIEEALVSGTAKEDLSKVEIKDFLLRPPRGPFEAIVANPPYVRHHRLSGEVKQKLNTIVVSVMGKPIDARAGYHVYFLIRALELLAAEGSLAFIVPSDVCEGKFSTDLWKWISKKYRIDAIVTFSPEASPFPYLDTNPIIILIRKLKPKTDFLWAKCTKAGTEELGRWIISGFTCKPNNDILVFNRTIEEGLNTGLTRVPVTNFSDEQVLGDFATVLRGIATGANEFFFLTNKQVEELSIPAEFLIRAVGRTRDIKGNEITPETLLELEKNNRPTRLFSPNGQQFEQMPESVRTYLRKGEGMGLNKRSLISTRRPWYKMETRSVPPFLFAYLGRRNARFIKNNAKVVPLTGFLCIYPKKNDPDFIDKLWRVLNHNKTIENLGRVGKTYGGGAIKVEPRALEKLPLPNEVVEEAGLKPVPKVKPLDAFF